MFLDIIFELITIGAPYSLLFCILLLIILPVLYIWCVSMCQKLMTWRISNRLGVKKGWLALIPIADCYLFGRLAQEDRNRNHPEKKPIKWGRVYLALLMAQYAIVLLFIGLLFLVSIYPENDIVYWISIIIGYGLFGMRALLALATMVLFYTLTYKIYHVMAGSKAVLMLILSIVLPFLQPVFFLIMGLDDRFPAVHPADAEAELVMDDLEECAENKSQEEIREEEPVLCNELCGVQSTAE